jgi:hypothetical protein
LDSAQQAVASLALRHEDDVLNLHSRLEAKRAAASVEAQRIAAEEKKIKFEQMQQVMRFLGKGSEGESCCNAVSWRLED